MYEIMGIKPELEEWAKEKEEELKVKYEEIDEICEYNSVKVLHALQQNHISEIHFGSTSGYGYNDIGREAVEKVFAQIFRAEDALVRGQFISGTHALTVALFAFLRPGDTLLSITGKPYDTLDEVIGIVDNPSSLKSFGVSFEQIDLEEDGSFAIEKIQNRLQQKKVKLIEIQRSKGYSTRKSIGIQALREVIKKIREVDKDVIIMIDNCYCEFVAKQEPIEVGADIVVGSLIKNLGAGIAPNGAYIGGRKDLVELAAERLTVPGEGKELGPTLGINKSFLQGIFMAPSVVASSLKTAILASKLLGDLGYYVEPDPYAERADIVQTIYMQSPEKLIAFCQGIQMGSPVDAMSIPEPWDMPGYTDKVIMAAGAFTQGSSIELSCDGPIRPPYIAFLQGGLTYEYGKLGVLKAIQNMQNS